MAELALDSVGAIESAQAYLVSQRPGHGPLLIYYAGVFLAQERMARQLDPPAPRLDPQWVSRQRRAGLPLLALADFPWPPKATAALLEQLCQLTVNANPGKAAEAHTLSRALAAGSMDATQLCTALLHEDGQVLQQAADTLGISSELIVFLTYHALRPSLCLAAEQLKQLLDGDDAADDRTCPICGTAPGLSVLTPEGERRLVCGFCWHRWPTRRRACPWCGNVDAGTLHYFAPEQEPEYRVELCDGCQHYLKTLDLRHLERPAYLPLEQVASLHLDLKAQEMGYRRFDTGRGAVAIPGAA